MGNTCNNPIQSERDLELKNSFISINNKGKGISQIESSIINEEILEQYQIQTTQETQSHEKKVKSIKTKNQLAGIKEIDYEDGSHYEGRVQNDLPHGKGIFKHNNKDDFQGEFIEGLAYGPGIYYYDDGNLYEGDFVSDKKNGMGKETYFNGDFYHGKFVNGKKFGRGKYTYKNGSCYNGLFKNDKRNGLGIFKTNEGDYYIGDWVNNFMDGKGKLSKADGEEYEGSFSNGYYQGEGKLIKNGFRHEGFFNVGIMNGVFDVVEDTGGDYKKIKYENGVEVSIGN